MASLPGRACEPPPPPPPPAAWVFDVYYVPHQRPVRRFLTCITSHPRAAGGDGESTTRCTAPCHLYCSQPHLAALRAFLWPEPGGGQRARARVVGPKGDLNSCFYQQLLCVCEVVCGGQQQVVAGGSRCVADLRRGSVRCAVAAGTGGPAAQQQQQQQQQQHYQQQRSNTVHVPHCHNAALPSPCLRRPAATPTNGCQCCHVAVWWRDGVGTQRTNAQCCRRRNLKMNSRTRAYYMLYVLSLIHI